ncbi:hypothetical protein JDV02_001470 [Purpureocillium takamizusanense]|uniref:Uncharacterized protein n=1 Tax=Purpureocillium takamizusanense TaxID=2060973 RepID=A0A9Q8Q6U1_9HYPO|nr:uncharacterized protein JDV02_001470 [Purpureocillium takamizusanense]UNI14889.1 hypothetical protein JDV02_001470 [Purpureocillium takamizusanense]
MDTPDDVAINPTDAVHDARPFEAVSVGTCYAQTANERFGRGARDVIRERDGQQQQTSGPLLPSNWLGGSESNAPDVDLYARVPTMQHFRNNLTALSHLYNLYFVAYQGQIFVYVPRSIPKQTIPCDPGIKLSPPQSLLGSRTGGYQDTANPHTINHLIVGVLGLEEIIVASYDDGDVVAYYAKDIADCILDQPRRPWAGKTATDGTKTCPKPFFHDNVGKSAWGLAVHQESRLIAVSSNKCEVTVFAPALAGARKRAKDGADTCSKCKAGTPCDMIETHVRQRARNWRIVVRFGRLVDNMPNIAFVDDNKGFAELICAVDIKGAVWLAHIWKPKQAAVRLAPSPCMTSRSSDAWPSPSRGWGVLPLATADFLTVKSFEKLLGISAHQASESSQMALNIMRCLERVPDNPCVPLIPLQLPGPPPMPPAFLTMPMAAPVAALVPFNPALVPQQADPSSSEESESEASGDSDAGGVVAAVTAMDNVSTSANDGNVSSSIAEQSESAASGDDVGSAVATVDDDSIGDNSSSSGVENPDDVYEVGADADEDENGDNDTPVLTIEPTNGTQAMLFGDMPDEVLWFSTQNVAPESVPGTAGLGTSLMTLLGSPDGANILLPSFHKTIHAHHMSNGSASGAFVRRRLEAERQSAMERPASGLDMVYFPHTGKACAAPADKRGLPALLAHVTLRNDNKAGADKIRRLFGKRHRLLRLHEKEVELRDVRPWTTEKQPHELGVFCPETLTVGSVLPRAARNMFQATSRLSMVAHVQELSLVVVASPVGRVLLLTPTRLCRPQQQRTGELRHGFRVEWVLPRRSDDKVHRKTMRPLHGMAVGPVPGAGADGLSGDGGGSRMQGPHRRYRLMLHYRSHDILTYEISREEQTGRLCII